MKTILKYFLAVLTFLVLSIVILALLPLADPLKQKEQASRLIITNVNIVDVANNNIIRNKSLVIGNGRIERILNQGDTLDESDISFDAQGKYAISGLWDMHSHLAFDTAPQMAMPLHIANGVINLRDMQGVMNINQSRRDWIREIDNGELLGPRLPGVAAEIVGDNYDERNVLDVVNRASKNSQTFIKIYSGILSDRYFSLADSAKKQNVVFAGHYPSSIDPVLASNAGQKSFEHAHLFINNSAANAQQLREYYQSVYSEQESDTPERPTGKDILGSFVPDKFNALVDTMIKNETYFCPTHITKNYEASVNNERFVADDRRKYVPYLMKFIWADDVEGMRDGEEIYHKEFHQRGLELTRLAHQKGVKILAGTDSYDPYSFPGFSLHNELEQLVQAGLSTAEALATATLNPAEYFGLTKDYGSVSEGKIADIVLLNKNPLEDIRHTQSIDALVYNGALYSREELDAFLGYVEENVSGLAGVSLSLKMFLGLMRDNTPEARNNPEANN